MKETKTWQERFDEIIDRNSKIQLSFMAAELFTFFEQEKLLSRNEAIEEVMSGLVTMKSYYAIGGQDERNIGRRLAIVETLAALTKLKSKE